MTSLNTHKFDPVNSFRLNGEARPLEREKSIAELLTELSLVPQRVAVEVNESLVRRAEFGNTVLRPGDRVEIVTLVGGG